MRPCVHTHGRRVTPFEEEGKCLSPALALVPVDGFVTLRECRRKGFSEAETRQICLLEPALFEIYEHAPPNGGPLSVRIRRPGSVDEPEEGRRAS